MAQTTPSGQPNPMQPGEYTPPAPANVVGFKVHDIDPPTSVYIQRDDQLLVVATSQLTPTLTITARLWLAAEGRITTIQQTLNLTTKDFGVSLSIPLAEGYLLSVVVTDFSSTMPGQTLVTVYLNRGIASTSPAAPGAVLISDYLGGRSGASWPAGRIFKGGDGQGALTRVFPTAPGAGADWSTSPGPQELWEVVSVTATLTTSATVANRNVQLIIDSGSPTPLFISTANAAIPASTTATFNASQINQTSTLITTTVFAALPPRNLLNNLDRIRTLTQNLQAGDQWSSIFLMVRNWELF